jgi:hypothetical protein
MNFRQDNILGGNTNLEFLKRADIFWHNCFAPYSMGDHFMQLIPFIALAKSIKLHYIDESGRTRTTSMYDAYKILHTDERHELTNEAGVFGLDSRYHYVKNKKDIRLVEDSYQKLKDMDELIHEIEAHISSLSGFTFAPFSSAH